MEGSPTFFQPSPAGRKLPGIINEGMRVGAIVGQARDRGKFMPFVKGDRRRSSPRHHQRNTVSETLHRERSFFSRLSLSRCALSITAFRVQPCPRILAIFDALNPSAPILSNRPVGSADHLDHWPRAVHLDANRRIAEIHFVSTAVASTDNGMGHRH